MPTQQHVRLLAGTISILVALAQSDLLLASTSVRLLSSIFLGIVLRANPSTAHIK